MKKLWVSCSEADIARRRMKLIDMKAGTVPQVMSATWENSLTGARLTDQMEHSTTTIIGPMPHQCSHLLQEVDDA